MTGPKYDFSEASNVFRRAHANVEPEFYLKERVAAGAELQEELIAAIQRTGYETNKADDGWTEIGHPGRGSVYFKIVEGVPSMRVSQEGSCSPLSVEYDPVTNRFVARDSDAVVVIAKAITDAVLKQWERRNAPRGAVRRS